MKYYTLTQNTDSSAEFTIHLNNIRQSFINNHYSRVSSEWMKVNNDYCDFNIIIHIDFNELQFTDVRYLSTIYSLFADAQEKYPRKRNVNTYVYLLDCSTIAQLFVDMVIKIVSRNCDVKLIYYIYSDQSTA